MNYKQLIDIFKKEAGLLVNDKSDPQNIYRARAYAIAAGRIEKSSDMSGKVSMKHLADIGLSVRMLAHVEEYMSAGIVPDSTYAKLTAVMGIGMAKAKELVAAGLRDVNDLNKKKYNDMLNNDTRIFLKLKPIVKIPRDIIKQIEPALICMCKPGDEIILVGSYRRKKEYSRDIDVMVIGDSLEYFVRMVTGKYHDVTVYQNGPGKVSMIIKIGEIYCKMDAFAVNKKYKIPMLLYSTGSKEFNIRMRSIAKNKGYLLNQYGLFSAKSQIPVVLKSEQAYFDILGMKYLSPEQR